MIEQGIDLYIFIAMIVLVLLLISISIPFYGFMRKRWKGLIIGCLLQPIIYSIGCVFVIIFFMFYHQYKAKQQRKDAMVTVKKADTEGNTTHVWYLKANEECFYENLNLKDYDTDYNTNFRLYDVLPYDSTSVCVDDKIVVRFDIKGHKVTATEYDEPLEVVSVDWNKVNDYFKNRP